MCCFVDKMTPFFKFLNFSFWFSHIFTEKLFWKTEKNIFKKLYAISDFFAKNTTFYFTFQRIKRNKFRFGWTFSFLFWTLKLKFSASCDQFFLLYILMMKIHIEYIQNLLKISIFYRNVCMKCWKISSCSALLPLLIRFSV